MQAAEQPVEILEAGRHPGHVAVALERGLGHVDRFDDGGLEGRQPALGLAGLGQAVELLFGGFDLVGGGDLEVLGEGVVDHVLAERDQLAPEVEVVDGAAVVARVHDGDGAALQLGEVVRAAGLGERLVLVEQGLERDRVGLLAALDQLADGLEDASVGRVGEVLGAQEIGDPLEGVVVLEDRAEQRLLGLVVDRRRAVG